MGLAWQQGPLAAHAAGRFLTPEPLPQRVLFAEPLRRRMRARFAGDWVADSEDVVLLHEPGRYPVAYFPLKDVADGALLSTERTTRHRELGPTAWYTVRGGDTETERAAWRHTEPPDFAREFEGRVAFAWRAMDAFYEEDDRILGHAADAYHRIDIRSTSRELVVRDGDRVVARSQHPLVLYESGFAPRWYVPRADVDEGALQPVEGRTFCPYKGLADYFAIGGTPGAAWSYEDAYPEVERVSGHVSFEPDKVEVTLDGERLRLEPGQNVISHGMDRGLDVEELRRATA
ncbi:DUF427 domain-containing protein [Streptomyces sp. NBC_01497]|uniref:DUF427 domain-containing protein n=1 Tax=Streptomyces sp. NBC_01497 TaxID=2903885 RepID=UPI002E373DCA|nr:DUF427 domain-containing protein [Streptomyces sp. NBC_01497]